MKRCMVGQLRNLISPPVTYQGVDVLACEKLTYLFIRPFRAGITFVFTCFRG